MGPSAPVVGQLGGVAHVVAPGVMPGVSAVATAGVTVDGAAATDAAPGAAEAEPSVGSVGVAACGDGSLSA